MNHALTFRHNLGLQNLRLRLCRPPSLEMEARPRFEKVTCLHEMISEKILQGRFSNSFQPEQPEPGKWHGSYYWHHFWRALLHPQLTWRKQAFYSSGCRCSVVVSHCGGTKPGRSAQRQSISFMWQRPIKYLCIKKRFASAEFNHFRSWAQPRNIMFTFVFVNTFKLGFQRAECAVSVKRWRAGSAKYLCSRWIRFNPNAVAFQRFLLQRCRRLWHQSKMASIKACVIAQTVLLWCYNIISLYFRLSNSRRCFQVLKPTKSSIVSLSQLPLRIIPRGMVVNWEWAGNICPCFWSWRLSKPGCLYSFSVINVALHCFTHKTHTHTQLNSSWEQLGNLDLEITPVKNLSLLLCCDNTLTFPFIFRQKCVKLTSLFITSIRSTYTLNNVLYLNRIA